MEERLTAQSARVNHLVFGGMLIVAGLLLFANGLSIWNLFTLWPLIVVGIGISSVMTACCMARLRSGVATAAIGLWLSLNELTSVRYRDSWPLLLVAIGGLIAWGAIVPGSRCQEHGHDH